MPDETGRPFGPLEKALPDEYAIYEAGWQAVTDEVKAEWPAACVALWQAAEALRDAALQKAESFLQAHKDTYGLVENHEAYQREWLPAYEAVLVVAAYRLQAEFTALHDAMALLEEGRPNATAELDVAIDALILAIERREPALSTFLTAESWRAFSVAVQYVAAMR